MLSETVVVVAVVIMIMVLLWPQSDVENLLFCQGLHFVNQGIGGVELCNIIAAANTDSVYENVRNGSPSCLFRYQILQPLADGV
jgi:hypothetical protein